MNFQKYLIFWPYYILKLIVLLCIKVVKFIALQVFHVELLSSREKEGISKVERFVKNGFGEPISLSEVNSKVAGLTPVGDGASKCEFAKNLTDEVKASPFVSMPRTTFFSYAVKDRKRARWQLFFYQEAIVLLERTSAYVLNNKEEGFLFNLHVNYVKKDEKAIENIPIKERMKLALADVLYCKYTAEDSRYPKASFYVQKGFRMEFKNAGTDVATLQFVRKDDLQECWTELVRARSGVAPTAEQARIFANQTSSHPLLTADEKDRVGELLHDKERLTDDEVYRILEKYGRERHKRDDVFGIEPEAPEPVYVGKSAKLKAIWDDALGRIREPVVEEQKKKEEKERALRMERDILEARVRLAEASDDDDDREVYSYSSYSRSETSRSSSSRSSSSSSKTKSAKPQTGAQRNAGYIASCNKTIAELRKANDFDRKENQRDKESMQSNKKNASLVKNCKQRIEQRNKSITQRNAQIKAQLENIKRAKLG